MLAIGDYLRSRLHAKAIAPRLLAWILVSLEERPPRRPVDVRRPFREQSIARANDDTTGELDRCKVPKTHGEVIASLDVAAQIAETWQPICPRIIPEIRLRTR